MIVLSSASMPDRIWRSGSNLSATATDAAYHPPDRQHVRIAFNREDRFRHAESLRCSTAITAQLKPKLIVHTGEKEPYSGHAAPASETLLETLQRQSFTSGNQFQYFLPAAKSLARACSSAYHLTGAQGAERGPLNRMLWGRQVCDELKTFAPTHLLMRAAGDVAFWQV